MNAEVVSSILEEGMIISSKLPPSNAWYYNIVCKCSDSQVCILLVDGYVRNTISQDSNIVLKFANEYFEYLFEGRITAITPGNPGFVHIQVNRAEELVNTRMFPRYDVNLGIHIKPLWKDEGLFSVLTNLSLGGIAFVCKNQFDYGEECEISIYLSDNRTVSAKGKIIRRSLKGEMFDYSMQFIEMIEEDSNLLADYIEDLEQQWEKMRERFFKMQKV